MKPEDKEKLLEIFAFPVFFGTYLFLVYLLVRWIAWMGWSD